MAKHDAKWTPDTDDVSMSHPKTREQVVQENRAKRDAEREEAPELADRDDGDSDGDSRTPAAVPIAPRTEPVRTHSVHAAESGHPDVRIGPGDAGAAGTPMKRPEPAPGRNDSWARALRIIGITTLIAAILALLF